MEKGKVIRIVLKNGMHMSYMPEEYTEYKYDGKYFIVINGAQWIGLYNLDVIGYIRIEEL